jgi:hypothetical protein
MTRELVDANQKQIESKFGDRASLTFVNGSLQRMVLRDGTSIEAPWSTLKVLIPKPESTVTKYVVTGGTQSHWIGGEGRVTAMFDNDYDARRAAAELVNGTVEAIEVVEHPGGVCSSIPPNAPPPASVESDIPF